MSNDPMIFKDIPMERFSAPSFSFDHPKGAKVIGFNRRNSGNLWRLLINLNGTEFSYDIKQVKIKSTVEKMAGNLYGDASTNSFPEDLPPFQIQFNDLKGWRFRYRFVDGFTAELVVETILFEPSSGNEAYQIQYAATVEKYLKGLIVLEMIARTFSFTTA